MVFEGYAILDGIKTRLKTLDVSQKGALVEMAGIQPFMEAMELDIHLDMGHLDMGFKGMAAICRVKADNNSTLCGVRFNRFDAHSDLLLAAHIARFEHQQPTLGS